MQYHCDVCKESGNLFIVKVPEMIYFCLECCEKNKSDKLGRTVLHHNNPDSVKEFKEEYL